ncbi:uncharacterized protein KQ657_000244 [Scheffersomyces spartinae]|uniref:Ubiquitin carboxyl-terminal hydrolase n=1 Tax=Scheffersomyces spartinae TaxID=45513 RepID=A0A9P8AKS2_9ASCO|nr:uncharacterized protein KQ657_000244 [Scheffersomyces spartinae]KAG7196231.1 hypothetical protein KQ657_000244 [Scheffersomyces spartinae]
MEPAVIPLESNPEIFTQLAGHLGLSPLLGFHDVYSISDPSLLAFLPQPVYGVILLFPLTEQYETYRKAQDTNVSLGSESINWFKQTIKNGCGLYALLHLLANVSKSLVINNSPLDRFLTELKLVGNDEVEYSHLIQNLEKSIKLDDNFGSQGQTQAPSSEDDINFHFITFIKGQDNHSYELDGRRKGPIDLTGSSTPSSSPSVLEDPTVVEKIQYYMDMAGEQNAYFSLMALAPSMD